MPVPLGISPAWYRKRDLCSILGCAGSGMAASVVTFPRKMVLRLFLEA